MLYRLFINASRLLSSKKMMILTDLNLINIKSQAKLNQKKNSKMTVIMVVDSNE